MEATLEVRIADKPVELDQREDLDHQISLWWTPKYNTIHLVVKFKSDDITRAYIIPNDKARDAFVHPFLYVEA